MMTSVGKLQDLTGVTEARRREAMERFVVLRPHLEGGTPLSDAAAAAGIPVRTAERWLARYRAEGITGLARRNPTGHRDGRFPDQLVALVEGLFLRRPPPSIATVHRLACEVARNKGWPEPSYMTVHRIATGLDPALVSLAQEGERHYREAFDLIYRREAERSNAIWQADHTELEHTRRRPAPAAGAAVAHRDP